jgi:glucose-1-phosphate adenylyltransferase
LPLNLLFNNVVIKGGEHLPDMDTDEFVVRDGVVVVKKGAVIPEGARIM